MSREPSPSSPVNPQDILVVRFGSLGDLCLLGWALAELADRPGRKLRRVTLVTKAGFAPLMEQMRGVDEVVRLPGSRTADVARLAGRLRRRPWDVVIDAHSILRGHLLLGLMGRRSDRRLAKDTTARLAFMGLGHRAAHLDRTMHDRFAELIEGLAPARKKPGTILPPLSSLAAEKAPLILGLAPGAQWDTKRWPAEHFASLLRRWLVARSGTLRIFIGPREESWFEGSVLEIAARESGRTEIIRNRSLTEVATLLSECQHLVTNDSGLLHLAEAVGTPVLALFGPTVREFGYFPVLESSSVLERTLDCRPCSRNGKRPCHRGDLACLVDITPEAAFAALDALEVE